jgi:DHA1 family bicyclomycin/chloramphenicol resistance-like MFS transporter
LYEPIFVIILAGMAMIGAFATDTFLPSFPSIAAEFGLSQAAVQLSLSIYLLCYATMCLLYGPLSDALGRRKVVIASLAAFLISSAADFGDRDRPFRRS